MKPLKNSSISSIAEIIESRSPVGRQDSVQGWHNLLKKLLSQMTPYLKEGHLVTFRTLNDREKEFFEWIGDLTKVLQIHLKPGADLK